MSAFFTTPHQNWLDVNGKPLAGGRLFVYDAGTTTPTNTWQDAAHSQLNTNPIILDAGGFTSIWLDPAKAYKFRMVDALGNQQWTVDNYVGATLTGNMLVPINFLLPATGLNTINNGDFEQIWRWQLTTTGNGLYLGESAPSTGTPNSSIVAMTTMPGSTVSPLRVFAQSGPGTSAGFEVTPAGDLQLMGSAKIVLGDAFSQTALQHTVMGSLHSVDLAENALLTPAGWAASVDPTAAILQIGSLPGGLRFFVNAGLVPGAIFTPSQVFAVDANGAITSQSLASGITQCVQALPDGTLVGTGTPCGAGAGGFVDNETVAGSGTSWTLAQTPNPAASLQLFQNGTLLVQGVDYTLTGSTITTTNAYYFGSLTAWYRTSGGGVTPPPTPQLSSLTVSPTSVQGGSANSTGTVTLTAAAPTGGVLVTLTSSNTNAATVPASVTVATGSLTATFTVTSLAVSANTTSTITASYSGATRTANLTVTAPVVAQPIYGGVGAQGATSGTLSGTQVTLNNGAVLAQMKTTPEAVNDQFPSASTFFSPSDQCIYLLLTAAGHTFVDQNNNAFAFDPPLQITVSGRTLYLYASSNPLYMTWRLKLTG